MGSLLDEMEANSQPSHQRCAIAEIRDKLNPADRADLDAAMLTDSITGRAISKILTKRGYPVSDNTVKRHRRGDCRCPTTSA